MLRGVHQPLRPLVRPTTIALMDEPLGLPRQPRWLVATVHGGLRLLRLAPPRRTPYRHRPTTYPHGHRLADLGPASVLDELHRTCPAPAPHDEGATA